MQTITFITGNQKKADYLAKYFVQEIPYEDICRLLDGKDRSAIGRCAYGYYDGEQFKYFE